jgi:hypothetical protein
MPTPEPLLIPETLRIQLADGQLEEMPLEEYLKGVVPTEMGLQKPLEALKAQAIAARSYAVTTRRHARDSFDVCTTTHCQAWKPDNRHPDCDQAVDETAGQIVTERGRIVGTPFFGHCDGRTRNSEDVWSGILAYCRSVDCICGQTTLHGHGVGMCQQGAVAMARQGATAQDILRHYYTGIEIAGATAIPRTLFRRSIIVGQVVDGRGIPRPGVGLAVTGQGKRFGRRTNDQGKFWVSGLPAGEWELQVRGEPVRYKGIMTDGRSIVDVRVAVPAVGPLMLKTMPLAYPRQLIGTLGYNDVQVTLTSAEGEETTLLGGSAPDFDPGGFSIPLPQAGTYTLQFLEQRFDLEIGDTALWLQFIPQPE